MAEYRKAVHFYCDYLLTNKIYFNNRVFSVKDELYDCPSMLSTTGIEFDSSLSARALKCASTQACGILKALFANHSKNLFVQKLLKKRGQINKKLDKKIENWKVPKLDIENINAELNSICANFQESNNFAGFLELKSLGKSFGVIRLPITSTRIYRKFYKIGKMKNSFLVNEHQISIRFDVDTPDLKSVGRVVGADQGISTCLTLSDGQVTKRDNHEHDLKSITQKLARKRIGSKAFKKAQDHRKNYVNWSINRLNFAHIKEVRLENIINIGYKNKRSRYLSHFCNTLVRNKLLDICKENGVTLLLQNSTYRSQRCCKCGWTLKTNRKAKLFSCNYCSYIGDADLNAAKNHEANLTELPKGFSGLKLNKVGFFWKEKGLYNSNGLELTVQDFKNQLE
jgi:transposase